MDIGGGSGNFALALHNYFSNIGIICEVYCLDTSQYDTWTHYADKVIFIKGSASELYSLFYNIKFDLIFANRVFHHFVSDTWQESINYMYDIMKQIAFIIKRDGFLCITDYYYNGSIWDKSSSKIIYTLTSLKIPLLIKVFRKFHSKSTGVGVCFLSKKMWFSLFNKSGFEIECLEEMKRMRVKKIRYEIIYRIFLFVKFRSEDNLFILRLK